MHKVCTPYKKLIHVIVFLFIFKGIWLAHIAALSAEELSTPKPNISITFKKLPYSLKVGKEYEIIMEIKNEGADSYSGEGAFSGIHIEVENARPKNVLAYSSFSESKESKISWDGNIRWFEATYDNLNKNDIGIIRFNIIPRKLPVRIFYRGWIPDLSENKNNALGKNHLRPAYRDQSNWRDENSLRRFPANDDVSAPFCKALVYSGHVDIQDYRCFVHGFTDSSNSPNENFINDAELLVEAQHSTLNRLKDDEIKYLFQLVRKSLKSRAMGRRLKRPSDYPEILSKYLNTVYVTIYQGGIVKGCQGGTGDLIEATITATSNLFLDRRFDLKFAQHEEWLKNITIGIDILSKKRGVISIAMSSLEREIQLGIDGIEIRKGDRSAYYKSSVAVSSQMRHEALLNTLSSKAGLPAESWKNISTELYKNKSICFVETDNQKGFSRLIRATPFVSIEDINDKRIQQAIVEGGEWLARNQKSDGSFAYHYFPSNDSYSPEDNIVRQAGSAYGMAKIGKMMKNKKIITAADKAIQYLLTHIEFLHKDEDLPYLGLKNDDNLGANGLLLLALVESQNSSQYSKIMEKLVSSIIYKQKHNGQFNTRYTVDAFDGGQDFYPGEALLALARYYSTINQSTRVKNSLVLAFDYYSQYWRNNRNDAFVSWQSQAWSEFYKTEQDRKYAEFVIEMNDWLLDEMGMQYQLDESFSIDYWGGFKIYDVPGFTAAVYLEGLNEAYKLAILLNDSARETKYGKAMVMGTRFILNQQFNDENMHYIKNKPRTKGGFRMSVIDNSLRCDVTQHNIIALQKVLMNLNKEVWKEYVN